MAQGSRRRLVRAWVAGGAGPAAATVIVVVACLVGGPAAWAAAGAAVVGCAWALRARGAAAEAGRAASLVEGLRSCRDVGVAEAMGWAAEGFLVVDAAGRVVVANEAMADLLGVPLARLSPGTAVAGLREDLAGRGRRAAATLLEDPMGRRQALETDVGGGRWVSVGRTATRTGGYAVVARDVSAERREVERLRDARDALGEAIEGMGQGLCLFDGEGRLRVANGRFVELFGLDPACVAPGLRHADLVQSMVAAGHYPNQSGEDVVRFEEERARPGAGGETTQEISGNRTVCVRRTHLPGGGWVATYEDATERMRSLTRMSHMATHDALTGLANRTRLLEQVTEHASRASAGKAFALHYLDLDHFKPINDRLGHPCGDELLRQVATRLKACLRDRDTVARLGGDEFAIIQTGVSRPADAQVVADRIVRELSRPFTLDGTVVRIGVSIGVTIAPSDGVEAERLLKNADMALLKAKGEGRGAWRFFETAMDETVQVKRMIETELRDGITRDEFEMHYQPIVDLQGSRVVALEALVRWRHPVRGMVPPAEFIQVAEDVGAIRELGTFVIERACGEVARRRDGLAVAVNVSAVQLRDPGFVDVVRGALASSGLAPGRLRLEVTEGVLSGRGADVLGVLEEVGAMGVRLSLDDFGTGTSSLGYLRKYPFDRIKVDRSLLGGVGLPGGTEAEQAVRATIQMGRSLGIGVTAEGVETEGQRAWLAAEGCDEAQGYLFARPVPMAEVQAVVDACARGAVAEAA